MFLYPTQLLTHGPDGLGNS